jgi:hypothetical protein
VGKTVTQRKFTEIPITESAIEQVEKMAVKDGAMKGLLLRTGKGLNMNSTMMKNMKCWWNKKILQLIQTSLLKHREC